MGWPAPSGHLSQLLGSIRVLHYHPQEEPERIYLLATVVKFEAGVQQGSHCIAPSAMNRS
jgi:hypothetical protein